MVRRLAHRALAKDIVLRVLAAVNRIAPLVPTFLVQRAYTALLAITRINITLLAALLVHQEAILLKQARSRRSHVLSAPRVNTPNILVLLHVLAHSLIIVAYLN